MGEIPSEQSRSLSRGHGRFQVGIAALTLFAEGFTRAWQHAEYIT